MSPRASSEPRDLERIADGDHIRHSVAGCLERAMPQRRQQRDSRILDENRRSVAVLRGEQRAHVVHELIDERVVRRSKLTAFQAPPSWRSTRSLKLMIASGSQKPLGL
jgi:hypothetical protein